MSEENLTPWQKYKKNLGDTRFWDVLKSDNKTTDEKAEQRYSICKVCPELIKLTGQCKKCGCIMPLKTKLEGAACPIGKW
jgi:tRNA(Ile2) C34 agmatinyltransferase TiaS